MNWKKGLDEFESENTFVDGDGPDGLDEDMPPRRSLLFRIAALITALFFMGLMALTFWPGLKITVVELVSESQRKKTHIDRQLLQAVVKIDVVSRKKGAFIAVEQKSGTGFNINSSGVIVTNHHVIDGAISVTVKFPDGKTYSAARWSGKPEYDLALITLNKSNLPAVPLNMSGSPAPGDQIIIVGNPLGLNNIVVDGVISHYTKLKEQNVLIIDAPVYPGNSGSPVYDGNGKVIGVVFGNYYINDAGKDTVLGVAMPIANLLGLL